MDKIKEPIDRFRPEPDDRDRIMIEISDRDHFRAAMEAELGPIN